MADDDRPLTPQGERKFRAAAKGLARVVDRPDLLLTSPLPRAKATADIAARAFRRIEAKVEPALAGESVEGIVAALREVASTPTVALVGHEPVLSTLCLPTSLKPPNPSVSPSRREGPRWLISPTGLGHLDGWIGS